MKKRGVVDEYNVGALIAIIALFLLLYVILISPQEREELLGVRQTSGPDYGGKYTEEEKPSSFGYGGDANKKGLVLSESPGTVYPLFTDVAAKNIPSVRLFSRKETVVENLGRVVEVSSNWFYNSNKKFQFLIEDINEIDKISVLFNPVDSKGELILKLNSETFFKGEAGTNDLPIEIPRNLLKNKNELTLEASTPGISFLTSNFYELKDLQLVKRHKRENMRERRDFVLSKGEYTSLDALKLSFFVNCMTVNEESNLGVFLNGKVLTEFGVVCDAGLVDVDIDYRDLLQGRNLLEFEIDNGEYVLEQMLLEKLLTQRDVVSYTFALQTKDIQDIDFGGLKAVLEMDFGEGVERKSGTIILNGERIYFDTYDSDFNFDVSEIVREGSNYIKIIPNNVFDLLNLQVLLV